MSSNLMERMNRPIAPGDPAPQPPSPTPPSPGEPPPVRGLHADPERVVHALLRAAFDRR